MPPEQSQSDIVDRPRVIEKILSWLNSPALRERDQRVLSLVGPPGSGKSVVLRMLKNDPPPGVQIIPLPHPTDFFTPNGAAIITDPTDEIKDWFTQIFSAGFDPHATVTARLQESARRLCDQPPDTIPLFLVDGYDEMPDAARAEQQARIFCKQILDPLIEPSCTRMIIARRDEFEIHSFALRIRAAEPIRLPALGDVDKRFAHDQFCLLIYPNSLPKNTDAWMKRFSEYGWDNPLINRLLFEKANPNGALQLLTSSQLQDVFHDAVTRADIPSPPFVFSPSRQQFHYLHILANSLEETWSAHEAARELNIPVVSFYANTELQQLFRIGLILNTPDGIRHRLAPGFRGLLREIKTLP